MFLLYYSYLGLGLMAARKAILQHGNPEGETHLKTPCMHHILSSEEWHYRGVTYTVRYSKFGLLLVNLEEVLTVSCSEMFLVVLVDSSRNRAATRKRLVPRLSRIISEKPSK